MESSEGPAPPDPSTAPAEPAAEPVAVAVAVADPAAAADPAAPAPNFRPTWARRYIVAPFWAGLFGGGVLGLLFPLFYFLTHADIFERRHDGAMACFALFLAILIALWRGYLDPIRSYASLFGRILGVVFFGGACVGIVLALFIALFDAIHAR